MKCPKAIAWQWELGHKPQFSYGECLKEECAWWDDVTEQCCFKTLARGIVPIINDLEELVKKMPHAGQFLKERR